MPQDELDTIIQDIIAGYPGPEAAPAMRHQRAAGHPVLLFAAGTGLWVLDGILLYLFLWLLLHG